MRRFFYSVIGACLLSVPTWAAAQDATIRGLVTSETGTPLPNASVVLQGSNLGAMTRDDGSYLFTVPAARVTGQSATLNARLIGYQASSAPITLRAGEITQNFTLTAAAVQLTGVVVTALGMEREKSQLGTAQQQLNSEELNKTRTMSIIEQISGKVAGVQITGSGTVGGSPRIVIRGANSITGNNSPLFVVDGVAMSGGPTGSHNRGAHPMGGTSGGFDFGSPISDINPDDIETMSVLKGPNAAALYGSRAANGVIVITTKKGKSAAGGIRTELNTTYTWERPSILPDYQNLYGQGAAGNFRYVDGAGGGVNDHADQSWGPKLDGRLIDQFTGPQQPWVPHPNNVEDFFETGNTISTTIAASGGTERAAARLSLGQDYNQGYIPNSNFRRTSALLNGTVNINQRMFADATISYVRNNGRNRPGVGYNDAVLSQFVWFGRQVDINALRNYERGGPTNRGPSNREFNWNYNYHNNPFWMQYENPEKDTRDRFMGSAAVTYRPLEWLSGTLRAATDIYRFSIDQNWSTGHLNRSDQSFYGAFRDIEDYENSRTTDLLFTANRALMDQLTVNATVGGSIRQETFTTSSVATNGISVPNIYNVSNAAIPPTLGQFSSRRQVNSALASAAFTWNGWWTVEGTARNDWSSTLPRGSNSYFYPSVATSVVLTDAVAALRDNRTLSYLKLRAATARVGADTDPYRLRTTFTGNPDKFAGLQQYAMVDALANPDLKPEITTSHEFGVELGFFNGRATLDASYYDKSTKDQIFAITVSPASGFAQKSVNAGRITNKGVEALLSVTPVQNAGGFEWTSTLNFSRNRSRVAELTEGVTNILIGTGWYVNVEARVGEPYGSIFGYSFARDEATGKILTDSGLTVLGPRKVLGNIQPDWVGGWGNEFRYKNFALYGLLDVRRGGDIYSITNFFGNYSGVLATSLPGRESDWNSPGVVVDGIDVDTGEPNTINRTAEAYYQNVFPVNEPYIYDGSFVKLRELRLSADLPTRWANLFYADAVNIALTGRNLYTWTDVPNIDPEFSYSGGNLQGIEYAAMPNPRTFGLSVRITP